MRDSPFLKPLQAPTKAQDYCYCCCQLLLLLLLSERRRWLGPVVAAALGVVGVGV